MEVRKKTVFVSGRFNVLHPGHIRLFKFAKECGDKLIVAVESDELSAEGAHVPEKMRLEGVLCNEYVDEAFVINQAAKEVIAEIHPEVVVKGREHENQFNPELDVILSYGGVLLFSSGESVFSSVDLIREEFLELVQSTIKLPTDFIVRNKIDKGKIVKLIENFHQLKVLVVGDLIVDEYITCQPLGMSQEDPTIVVTPTGSKMFIGGAGIVAAHAAGLGAEVDLISISGIDSVRDFVDDQLVESNVSAILLKDSSRPTTLKQRFRSKGKSLLRVSHLHQDAISEKLQSQLLRKFKQKIIQADLLVFSDFNYGCLPQFVVDEMREIASRHGVLLVADSQSSSQVGNIARFRGMDLITPTEWEARISIQNQEDGIVVLAEKLKKIAKANHVLLKLGDDGLLVQTSSSNEDDIYTDQVPALNTAPVDVAGAGDSLLIASAMAMATGANIWEVGLLGSLAAAVQVGRIGNIPLNPQELIKAINQ